MGDVIAAERAEATVDHKGDCYRRPIGFNTALIVASDKYTYKARARSRSPDRVKEVVHVAPVVPSRRDDQETLHDLANPGATRGLTRDAGTELPRTVRLWHAMRSEARLALNENRASASRRNAWRFLWR